MWNILYPRYTEDHQSPAFYSIWMLNMVISRYLDKLSLPFKAPHISIFKTAKTERHQLYTNELPLTIEWVTVSHMDTYKTLLKTRQNSSLTCRKKIKSRSCKRAIIERNRCLKTLPLLSYLWDNTPEDRWILEFSLCTIQTSAQKHNIPSINR